MGYTNPKTVLAHHPARLRFGHGTLVSAEGLPLINSGGFGVV
jgi:hypothetical protein